jgi:hypothetical protein
MVPFSDFLKYPPPCFDLFAPPLDSFNQLGKREVFYANEIAYFIVIPSTERRVIRKKVKCGCVFVGVKKTSA